MDSYEYIVIGGGVMGASVAYQLAAEKRSVLLLEQFEIGHVRSASHGESRIFRVAYDHPDYINLARTSLEMWRMIEQEAGEHLLVITGLLDFGPKNDRGLKDTIESLQSEDEPFEKLTPKTTAKLFPQIQLPEDCHAIFTRDAGILRASKCVKVLLDRARQRGAHLVEYAAVREIDVSPDLVIVYTEVQAYSAKKLIVTAGPWSNKLLQKNDIQLPLTVTQEQVVYVRPSHPNLFRAGNFPVFCGHGGIGSGSIGLYGFPTLTEPGVKVAYHQSGDVTTADTRNFDLNEPKARRLIEDARKLLPDLTAEIQSFSTCLYTLTPDQHFIVDHLPGHPNVAIGTGFSGHGFKFAPVIGRMLIDIVRHGDTEFPHDLFRISRFAQAPVEPATTTATPVVPTTAGTVKQNSGAKTGKAGKAAAPSPPKTERKKAKSKKGRK